MTWRSGVCEANGAMVHYLRTGGARPPVVLLHGLMGSGACWTPVARALEDDFDVVSLEMATELRELNPRLGVAQVPDAGHGLPFDQPEALAAVVASFLRDPSVGDR